MSKAFDRLDLIPKRQSSVDRRIDPLTESIASLSRMVDLRFRDAHHRMTRLEQETDGLDRRIASLQEAVRASTSEPISMASQIVDARQRAYRAHRPVDATEAV